MIWSMTISTLVTAKIRSIPPPTRAQSPVIKTSKENWRLLIQTEIKYALETEQREKMKIMSRNLVNETLCHVFRTGYCAKADEMKNFVFSFVVNVITKVIHRGFLDKALNQSFNYWS